jgi:hypothetical protein
MVIVKHSDSATDSKTEICATKHAYCSDLEPSFCVAASIYGLLYGTMWNWLTGVYARSAPHEKEQLLALPDEKLIFRFCITPGNFGHPLQGKMIGVFVMFLLPSHQQQQLGKYWITHCLNCHCAIIAKFSWCLDKHQANAYNSTNLIDCFCKV